MTTQRLDVLRHDGELWRVQELLLRGFMGSQFGQILNFKFTSTDCWRGYVASWEIRHNQLYFVGIEGKLSNGELANFEVLFPNQSDGILADWVDCTVRIMKGDLVCHETKDHGPLYEWTRELKIERGILIEIGNIRADG